MSSNFMYILPFPLQKCGLCKLETLLTCKFTDLWSRKYLIWKLQSATIWIKTVMQAFSKSTDLKHKLALLILNRTPLLVTNVGWFLFALKWDSIVRSQTDYMPSTNVYYHKSSKGSTTIFSNFSHFLDYLLRYFIKY